MHTTIQIPRCWKRLVELEFHREGGDHALPSGEVIRGGEYRDGKDDPTAYHHDARAIDAEFEGGTRIRLVLNSDDRRYYCDVEIIQPSGGYAYCSAEGCDDEALYHLSDNLVLIGGDGEAYQVTIAWTGKDPYEV